EIRAEFCGERLHPLAERLALIGEGEFGALRGELLGDAPGDGVIVRDPHDETALAVHDPRHVCHPLKRWKTSVALVPPKPKELERTVSIRALSIRLRTIGTPSNSGSSSVIWALSPMKPACIIRRPSIDSCTPAAPSEWPVSDLVDWMCGILSPKTSRIAPISFESPTGVEVPCVLM